jgi:CRISPR/Cas system-associated exonuclease Cas4 (RecB family)
LKHGARLKGRVDGVSRLGDLNVAYMFWSRGIPKNMTEHDEFLFGLHMIALYEKGRAPALEIDSTSGLRYLVLVRRPLGIEISSPESKGLKIVDMSKVNEPLAYQNDLFLSTEHRLADVMSTLRQGIVDARSGDHCASCEYGELCRRSQEFGEEEAGASSTRTVDDE